MTTPASNTPYGIITDAMSDAGYIQDGQVPNGEQLAKYMRRLEDLINSWQTQGLKLWLNIDTPITLIANVHTYTLGPSGSVAMTKPLRVIEAYYVDSNQIRRPLIPLSWNDYIRLGNVTNTGPVSQYFVDKQATLLSVRFWLVPDATAATGVVHLLLQVKVVTPISLVEDMNFPVEWRMALRWGLADDISTGQPKAIMDRCQQRAVAYRAMLEDWDVEDTPTQFQPDSRSQYSSFRFR